MNTGPGDDQNMTGAVRAFPMTWWSAWTSVTFSIGLGLLALFSPPKRFSHPVYDNIKSIVENGTIEPMRVWGVVFLLLGVALAVGLRSHLLASRILLRAGATIYIFYSVLFFLAALDSPDAPFVPAFIYLYVVIHHLAAAQTIKIIVTLGEVGN